MNRAEVDMKERGYHFYKTSDVALNMIVERMNLEKLGLSLTKLPLCSETDSAYIEELIPRAKEGFALSMKSDQSNLGQDRDLISITTPFTIENVWSQIKLTDRQNTLPEYQHVLTSLLLLSHSGKVSFYQFPDPPTNIDYPTGMAETYWFNSSGTFESVWTSMEELESLTRSALYTQRHMSMKDMLKVGHFFMTSKSLAHIFYKL